MANITRIKNNQITDATITYAKIASGTLTGALFNPALTLNSNVTILGNLSVTGNTSTINSTNTLVNDPLIVFNNGYAGSPEYDIGMIANRNLQTLAGYGSVNTAFVWKEADTAFVAIATTETGITTGSITNSGWANVKVGNLTALTTTTGGLQAVAIGNVTPGTGAFTTGTFSSTLGVTGATTLTTATTGGLQAVAIGNVTPGTGAFTTGTFSSTLGVTGATTLTTATTGGLQAVAIGNVTPGTGAFTTGTFSSTLGVTGATTLTTATTGGLQAVAIGNVTPGSGAFTTGTFSSTLGVTGATTMTTATTGGLQAVAIGNATPGTGTFTTGGFTGNSTLSYLFSNVGTTSLTIAGNAITSNTGKIGLGSISNISVTGGASGYTITTDGLGVVSFNPANVLILGANAAGQLASNAVTLTSGTNVTDAIAQLNQILGKLTPAAPPNFPGNVATSVGAASTFSITSSTTSGIMTGDSARNTGWTQRNNIGFGNTYQLTGGTTFSAIRANTYTTSTLAAIKSGSGNVRVWLGGNVMAGYYVLTGSLGTVSNGNLTITNDTDYNNIKSSVAAGFWYSANISASGSNIIQGWNTVTLEQVGGYTTGNTNALLWYNDISSTNAGTPTYSNCSITLTTNSVVYSSTIPHLTSGAAAKLKGNLANLSGDTYSGNTNVTSSTGAGGAYNAPTAVTWAGTIGPAGYAGTVPLPRYFCNATYGSGGTLYYETTATTLTSGFGASTNGPTLSVTNNYTSASTSASQGATTGFAPGVTVLYKTGTNTQIEETSIPVNSVGTGSGNGLRIANPGSANNPAYTGTEAAFNSTSSTLQTYDCVNIGSGSQGVLAWSQTNYSTGYLPVGPNLSGQSATQYFTMRFTRTAVSKFNIKYTGTIAGLWVALPGLTESANYSSATNGWQDVSTAYAGAGIPGAGTLGNGSAGCAVGGVAVLNSAQTNKSVTATFGTLSSTNATSNYIYVRVALTSAQSLTALTMETATN
jgi:hypothetical protein